MDIMKSHLFSLKEAELKINLESSLRQWRKDGLSIRFIAAKLSKKGTPVKRATVDVWCEKLGIKEEMREICHEPVMTTH